MGAPVEAHDGNVDAVDAHGEAAILRRHPRGAGPGGEWLVSAVSVLQACPQDSVLFVVGASSWLHLQKRGLVVWAGKEGQVRD